MKNLAATLLASMFAAGFATGCDRLTSVEQRIERAQAAFDAGRDSAAMSDVKAVLEREPTHVGGRLLLARLSLRLGDPATARKELDRATQAGATPAMTGELDQAKLRRTKAQAELLEPLRIKALDLSQARHGDDFAVWTIGKQLARSDAERASDVLERAARVALEQHAAVGAGANGQAGMLVLMGGALGLPADSVALGVEATG